MKAVNHGFEHLSGMMQACLQILGCQPGVKNLAGMPACGPKGDSDSELVHQIAGLHSRRFGQPEERLQADPLFPPFHIANETVMPVRLLGQFLRGETGLSGAGPLFFAQQAAMKWLRRHSCLTKTRGASQRQTAQRGHAVCQK
jgi:hypothetical protein